MICRCRFPSTPKSFEPIGPTDTIMPAAACRPRTEAKNLHRTSRLDWRTPNTEADHRDAEGAGGRCEDGGCLPQARHLGSDVLQIQAKFGGMEVSDARRLKALEDENARLKKLLAEQMLDNAILKDVAAKNVWSAPSVQGFATSLTTIPVA
jgi:putative transposase